MFNYLCNENKGKKRTTVWTTGRHRGALAGSSLARATAFSPRRMHFYMRRPPYHVGSKDSRDHMTASTAYMGTRGPMHGFNGARDDGESRYI
jgi:hypothetical protein